jgi:hypothetical protein
VPGATTVVWAGRRWDKCDRRHCLINALLAAAGVQTSHWESRQHAMLKRHCL